jgi:hypothetical protein
MVDIPDYSKFVTSLSKSSPIPSLHVPALPIVRNPLIESAEANYASEFHQRLEEWINDFDASLDEEHEVGVRLVNFGQIVVFHLENMGYWNPSLITFSGKTDEGDPVNLIQHVSQISVLLMKLPRKDPTKPKHRIGFHTMEDETDKKQTSDT